MGIVEVRFGFFLTDRLCWQPSPAGSCLVRLLAATLVMPSRRVTVFVADNTAPLIEYRLLRKVFYTVLLGRIEDLIS